MSTDNEEVLDFIDMQLSELVELQKTNADLVAAFEAIDKILSSQQGLDYTYWSQAEKDIHELAKQTLAQVKED